MITTPQTGAESDPAELFRRGELDAAVAAALAQVRRKPTDNAARLFLAELSCFAGDWERAEKQLDTLSQQTTEAAVLISLFRQLLRGETARHQVLLEGRAPEIVTPLTPAMQQGLRVIAAVRDGDGDAASEAVAEMDRLRPPARGTCDGTPFDSIRDLDDRTAAVLEVITATGKYFWTPWETLEYLEFDPPKRAMDLLWRRTRISVRGGPEGEVYVPTRYAFANDAGDAEMITAAHRLGHATDWVGVEGRYTYGIGQRTLLLGDRDIGIMELGSLEFEGAGEETADEAAEPAEG